MLRILILFGIAIFALPASTEARTWHVEKDGSGDFTIIQDALDAAAPGDSVLIGPGRFDTFRPAQSITYGDTFHIVAWVTKSDLTIMGAGAEATTLGPDTYVRDFGGAYALGIFVEVGADVRIERLGVEGCYANVFLTSRTTIRECEVRPTRGGAFGITLQDCSGVQIVRCTFNGPNGIVTGQGVSNALIESCSFTDPTLDGIGVEIGNGAQNCTIRNCTFTKAGGAISFSLGGSGVVEDCIATEMFAVGIALSGGHVVVRRCEIGPGSRQSISLGRGTMEIYDSEIGGGTTATIWGSANLTVRNSHILNIGASSVIACCNNSNLFDLAYNWWGSSDVQQIEQWINDPYNRVTYLPLLDQPVAIEATSFGGLKSRY